MKPKSCYKCGSDSHTSFMCRHWGGKGGKDPVDKLKLYKPLRNESKKSHSKRMSTRRVWYENNPPDKDGFWCCYLNISSLCIRKLTRDTLTLEHVESKVRHPELKYDVSNIRPACPACNRLKGSRSLAQLVIFWPHLEKYLGTQIDPHISWQFY